ncbi:hypothetical protein QEZ52_08725 [Aliisedimentitalea scapharcae]|uniref:Glycerol-3-phosphate dehydrogenase n=1 Tax=Aliisedimentitalea scapharcae TaxID=1524259 RepID=A0ABZ2XXD8_9RHOB
MSEPVSNAAIEDVLSSIRRLVSEDSRREELAPEPREVPKPPRLVLTPSLRVAESAAESTLSSAQDSPAPMRLGDSQRVSIAVNDGDLQDGDQELTQTQAADAPETIPEELVADFVSDDLPDSQMETEAAKPADDADDVPWADPENTLFSAAKVEVLTDPVLVPEHPPHDQDDVQDQVERHLDDAAHLHEAAGYDDTADADEPLSARIAALETAINQSDDHWEPDGDFGDDYAGTPTVTIEWQDHVDEELSDPLETDDTAAMAAIVPDPEAAPIADTESTEVDEDLDVLAGDDTFLDEESLRELVADIVRQELQGALGERITRNVRKLVRREIHRALVAQELD